MVKLFYMVCLCAFFVEASSQTRAVKKITVHFTHVANNTPLLQGGSVYVPTLAAKVAVNKLKYYVSNFQIFAAKSWQKPRKNIFLIDAFAPDSFIITIPFQKIDSIRFQIGIDSQYNNSGAQSGALDPLNDMFWTWNTGYVFFKLEANAAVSTVDKGRIEHHIGGYSGTYKAMRKITLPVSTDKQLRKRLLVQMDVDKYWSPTIGMQPVITSPGVLAAEAANRFNGMFSLIKAE